MRSAILTTILNFWPENDERFSRHYKQIIKQRKSSQEYNTSRGLDDCQEVEISIEHYSAQLTYFSAICKKTLKVNISKSGSFNRVKTHININDMPFYLDDYEQIEYKTIKGINTRYIFKVLIVPDQNLFFEVCLAILTYMGHTDTYFHALYESKFKATAYKISGAEEHQCLTLNSEEVVNSGYDHTQQDHSEFDSLDIFFGAMLLAGAMNNDSDYDGDSVGYHD